MPNKQSHVDQARINEKAYQYLGGAEPPFVDWQVTSLFYAALQYVDAYLATKGIHPHDHRERDGWIARLAGLKQISSAYFELKDRSMDARYLRAKLPPGVQQSLYTNQFMPLRDRIAAII